MCIRDRPTAAATLAASSGVDVPYATIVKPITIWLILSFLAMDTPPLTSQLPPKHSIARPTTVSNAFMAISTWMFESGLFKTRVLLKFHS